MEVVQPSKVVQLSKVEVVLVLRRALPQVRVTLASRGQEELCADVTSLILRLADAEALSTLTPKPEAPKIRNLIPEKLVPELIPEI